MGARVSEPMVVVERIREGLFCCTWRMPPSSSGTLLKDDKCYVNTLQLHNEQQYSIAISWLPDNKFTLVVELQSSASVGEPQKEVPQLMWISYGAGPNQMMEQISRGKTWRITDFKFVPAGSSPRFWWMSGANNSQPIRLWMDFDPCTKGEKIVAQQMDELFESQRHCDVHFNLADGSVLGAHLAILSARSPVFSAMFQAGHFQESLTRRVRIHQDEPAVFRQMIRYLYSGRIEPEGLGEVQLLLVAADKYGLDGLKDECLDYILGVLLKPDNAVQLLMWANRHSLDRLIKASLDLMTVRHRRLVGQTLHELGEPSSSS